MAAWRTVLRYLDGDNQLGWSITNFRNDANAAAAFAAADAWNTLYMACCPPAIAPYDARISNENVWGDAAIWTKADFTQKFGSMAGKTAPLAECLLVNATGSLVKGGRSYYHLHGFNQLVLASTGDIDPTNAALIALNIQNLIYFMQYRPAPSPVHGLPAVNPPDFWDTVGIEGPYVRRLGAPFFLPGQRANK